MDTDDNLTEQEYIEMMNPDGEYDGMNSAEIQEADDSKKDDEDDN